MIKISVMYPNGPSAAFDMDYYSTKHVEIVERTIKPTRFEIEIGMDGPNIASGNLYFESVEAMDAGMNAAGEAQADVANFTNTTAVVQVSQIVKA